MEKKEMRICSELGNPNTCGKYSFRKISGKQIFVCISSLKLGDSVKIEKHCFVSREQFDKEAPEK